MRSFGTTESGTTSFFALFGSSARTDFSALHDWPSLWVKTTKGFFSFSGWTRTEAHDLSILLRYTPFMLWGVVPGSSGARATYAAASGVACSGSGAGSSDVDCP